MECPICNGIYHTKRNHCPYCGAYTTIDGKEHRDINAIGSPMQMVVAQGAERARQLPQSPRFFSLCDCEE